MRLRGFKVGDKVWFRNHSYRIVAGVIESRSPEARTWPYLVRLDGGLVTTASGSDLYRRSDVTE